MNKIILFEIEEEKNLYRFNIQNNNDSSIGSCYCYKSFETAFEAALKYMNRIKND